MQDKLGGRRAGPNHSGRGRSLTLRGLRVGHIIDAAQIDAQAFVNRGRGASLIPWMDHIVIRFVSGLAMVRRLHGDRLGKELMMRAEAGVSDGPDEKP